MASTDIIDAIRDRIATEPAHCFHAHVPGQGYVNDGNLVETRAEYLRQYRQAAEAELDNLGYAPGYAEAGYTQPDKGVLLADWNNLPKSAGELAEAAGYAIEWSDEWIACDDCQRIFRTSADSYVWRPSGQVFEADRECLSLCVDCLQEWAEANQPESEGE